jgi:hypothetical protein
MRACLPLLIASIVFVSPALALAEGADIASATVDQKSKAQAAYLAANAKYEAGNMEAALAGFRTSFDFVKSPNTARDGRSREPRPLRGGVSAGPLRSDRACGGGGRQEIRSSGSSAREDARWRPRSALRIDLAGHTGSVCFGSRREGGRARHRSLSTGVRRYGLRR